MLGEFARSRLSFIPSSLVSFQTFSTTYLSGVVLSKKTGYVRNYGQNPYLNYDVIGSVPFLYFGPIDPRLPAMERVVGIWNQESSITYPYSALSNNKITYGQLENSEFVIFFNDKTKTAVGSKNIAESRNVGSTNVFLPIANANRLTFIYENNKIVDLETRSEWSLLGMALRGPLRGVKLPVVIHGDPFWFSWAAFYPNNVIKNK
ncbi:DUF3179 domain-containing (seleno)protein [Bacillus sp. DJP31]|uniref:DUF3179 domain-containing (seleno)protein n=1 Tax=Bacillus sp. DJP31 TaxID=3409789 RepID=UPI003BB6554D